VNYRPTGVPGVSRDSVTGIQHGGTGESIKGRRTKEQPAEQPAASVPTVTVTMDFTGRYVIHASGVSTAYAEIILKGAANQLEQQRIGGA
jgi:hypothetical protein